MEEKYLLEKHEEILEFLLTYRKKNKDFTFSPRKNNNAGRLDKGYWFQGNEDYIFVPLYKRGCKENHTKTVGFVFQENRQYIEIVYKKVEDITENELQFYQEIEIFLKESKQFQDIKQLHKRKYQYTFQDNNLQNNLLFYIDTFRKKINELILKYSLNKQYFLENEEINKRLSRIDEIKQTYNKKIEEVIETLSSQENTNIKNIILYGAPGVGKTHTTQKLISLIEDEVDEKEIFQSIEANLQNDGAQARQVLKNIENRVRFITFHQSYSYEDFIEGFKPTKDGGVKRQNGIFREIVKDAKEDKKNNYYLIIDEINRGNISKIFGELITLIEEDKRDDYEVILPYSKEKFSVPSNLYIIATMNSTDKSIATIDIALRRRFTFLKMKPNEDLVLHHNAKILMCKLNEFIGNNLGEDYKLGHSYFMKVQNDADLEFVKEYKIKPLLEEYFYADEKNSDEAMQILMNEIIEEEKE